MGIDLEPEMRWLERIADRLGAKAFVAVFTMVCIVGLIILSSDQLVDQMILVAGIAGIVIMGVVFQFVRFQQDKKKLDHAKTTEGKVS